MLLASLFPDDIYTYPTAILAPLADSQEIRVVMAVALLPREEGLRGLPDAVLALVCLLKHLSILAQAVQLEEGARQLLRERRTSMLHKRMILLRGCHSSMWAVHIVLIG
jgi:hypothetical protein